MKRTLKSVFNRYTVTAALMLGLAASKSQNIQPTPTAEAAPYTTDLSSYVQAAPHSSFIPDRAIPHYIEHFYKRMRSLGNKASNENSVNTVGKRLNLSSMFNPGDSDTADRLNGLTPAQAQQKAWEFLKSRAYESLTRTRDGSWMKEALPAIEALYHDGISRSEEAHILNFLKHYTASDSYRQWEDQRREQIMRELKQNPRLQKLLTQWASVRYYHRDHNRKMEQYAIKQETLQIISDTMRKAFGMEPIPVIIDEIPDDLALWGVYTKTKAPDPQTGKIKSYEFILISHDLIKDSGNTTSDKLLDLFFEEVKHSIDSQMASDLLRGKIDADDVRFGHAAAFLLNAQNYAIPDKKACKSYRRLLQRRCEKSIDAYLEQYSERTAKEYAKKNRESFQYDARRISKLIIDDSAPKRKLSA